MAKKVERGILYFAGLLGGVFDVRPVGDLQFTLEELQVAVDGPIECMLAAVKGHVVYVNESGGLRKLAANKYTWRAASEKVYHLNGYGTKTWCVAGNIIAVYKAASDSVAPTNTIYDVLAMHHSNGGA